MRTRRGLLIVLGGAAAAAVPAGASQALSIIDEDCRAWRWRMRSYPALAVVEIESVGEIVRTEDFVSAGARARISRIVKGPALPGVITFEASALDFGGELSREMPAVGDAYVLFLRRAGPHAAERWRVERYCPLSEFEARSAECAAPSPRPT